MSKTATVARPVEETEQEPRRRSKQKTKQHTKRQPPYVVLLHNDDFNGMDFVVRVLKKVFGYGTTRCVWLMLKAHASGVAQVWTGPLEVAELKADQIRSCGGDPCMAHKGAGKLRVSLEPLE